MSKYDEDLKKACEILNNTELDELVQVAVEAMDNAATDIGMEASQEWHAKITLESALIHIAEKVAKRPSLTIPKSMAGMLDFIYDNHFDSNDDISWVIANIDFLPTDEDYYNFDGWINLSVDNHNLALAYLAGKALGVDLVKVVEG